MAHRPPDLTVPRVDLGVRPTPLEERTIDGLRVFVKRDDRTCPACGGNKSRALEFLLAPPPRRVLTFSTLSAYHALATAIHARAVGADCAAVLLSRGRPGRAVDALGGLGVRVRRARTAPGALLAAALLWRPGTRVVLPGGMGPRGSLGYVLAALELDPPPRRLYLPLGTGTTAVGLLAGLALRGAETEVRAVRVVRSLVNGPRALRRRVRRTLAFLARHGVDTAGADPDRVGLLVVEAEGAYGEPTPGALRAAAAAAPLPLEPTYSGKALAALLAARDAGATFLLTCPAGDAPPARPGSVSST